MQNLIINLDKLHTTDLGAARIKRNLNLQVDDVVLWCRESVKQADIVIRQGKNWYVYRAGVVITINAYSNVILTNVLWKALSVYKGRKNSNLHYCRLLFW